LFKIELYTIHLPHPTHLTHPINLPYHIHLPYLPTLPKRSTNLTCPLLPIPTRHLPYLPTLFTYHIHLTYPRNILLLPALYLPFPNGALPCPVLTLSYPVPTLDRIESCLGIPRNQTSLKLNNFDISNGIDTLRMLLILTLCFISQEKRKERAKNFEEFFMILYVYVVLVNKKLNIKNWISNDFDDNLLLMIWRIIITFMVDSSDEKKFKI